MSRFFSLDNPVWRFIGNLADFFLLSILFYLSCIPVVTAGAGMSAIYYVTLKMVAGQEGYTFAGWRHSFKENLKQGSVIWILFLAAGALIIFDFFWCLSTATLYAKAMFLTLLVVSVLYLMNLSFIFPLLARCKNTTKALLKMNFAICIRSFLPVLSTVIVTAAFVAVGIFLFWPILLFAPGLSAYLNSYVIHHCFETYGLNLPLDTETTPAEKTEDTPNDNSI